MCKLFEHKYMSRHIPEASVYVTLTNAHLHTLSCAHTHTHSRHMRSSRGFTSSEDVEGSGFGLGGVQGTSGIGAYHDGEPVSVRVLSACV